MRIPECIARFWQLLIFHLRAFNMDGSTNAQVRDLVVDDSRDMAVVMAKLLERRGNGVQTATEGLTALGHLG